MPAHRTALLASVLGLAAGCGSSSTIFVVTDGGPDGGPAGTDAGLHGDGGGAGVDGGDASDGGSLAKCTRTPALDADCDGVYGAAASKGYVCTDVFFSAPPCSELTTKGCTEVCTNRCCP